LNSYIGGVGSFLGPALGAAAMTFFGYAASDATQSWLLYQGVLFVLVMMFMPAGLSGLIGTTGRLVRRHGALAVAPVALLAMAATLLLAAGGVFVIEMLQRLCSQDYRSLVQMSGSPVAIKLFGHPWSPAAVSTWLAPLSMLAAGATLALLARRRLVATASARSGNGHE
jgi:branched-chain amino acid transport system permease protein